MQYINLICKKESCNSLKAFAMDFFKLINIEDFEERDSSHYINETYFKGTNNNFTFTIFEQDDFDRSYYMVHIESRMLSQAKMAITINELIIDKVKPNGFTVSKIINYGLENQTCIGY